MEQVMARRLAPRLIASDQQAISHIIRYQDELRGSEALQARLSYAPAWYAVRDAAGVWRFAPSKFVGDEYASVEEYLADSGKRGDRDGRQTERVLSQWFVVVPSDSRLGRELSESLTAEL